MKKTNEGKSNKNTGTKLPGYPHYPEGEDIMGKKGEERMDVNVEDLSKRPSVTEAKPLKPNDGKKNSTPEIVPGTEADLTPEDIQALGSEENNNDGGDDELLSTF